MPLQWVRADSAHPSPDCQPGLEEPWEETTLNTRVLRPMCSWGWTVQSINYDKHFTLYMLNGLGSHCCCCWLYQNKHRSPISLSLVSLLLTDVYFTEQWRQKLCCVQKKCWRSIKILRFRPAFIWNFVFLCFSASLLSSTLNKVWSALP